MVTFIHKISDPNGLHAINAARLARFCRDCPARVRVACRDTAADEWAAKELKTLAGELL